MVPGQRRSKAIQPREEQTAVLRPKPLVGFFAEAKGRDRAARQVPHSNPAHLPQGVSNMSLSTSKLALGAFVVSLLALSGHPIVDGQTAGQGDASELSGPPHFNLSYQ